MIEFMHYHPVVNLIYFFGVIFLTVVYKHPLMLILSLIFACVSFASLFGFFKMLMRVLLLLLPTLAAGAVNPLFNHRGVTVLAYFPSGNPLTLESLIYGLLSGLTLLTVIMWYFSVAEVMTSDKLMALGARRFPQLTLLFAVTLRFISKFTARAKAIRSVRGALFNPDMHSSELTQKCSKRIKLLQTFRRGVNEFSVLVTWSLESAIESAQSMKSRGYGSTRRSAYELYVYERRDVFAGLIMLVLLAASILAGGFDFNCFPSIKMPDGERMLISALSLLLFGATPMFAQLVKNLSRRHFCETKRETA